MQLPQSLTTVTKFSKLLAMFLFILLPFLGFYLGTRYQQSLTPPIQNASSFTMAKPTPTPDLTANWKTYTNKEFSFTFAYPNTATLGKPNGEELVSVYFFSDRLKKYSNIQPREYKLYDGYTFEISLVVPQLMQNKTFDTYVKESDAYAKNFCDLATNAKSYWSSLTSTTLAGEYTLASTQSCFGIEKQLYYLEHNNQVYLIIVSYAKGKDNKTLYANDISKILSTFKFTNSVVVQGSNTQKCAQYTRNGIATTTCATCGNGTCEPYETCTSSSSNNMAATSDCGQLYCPKDCNK